MATITIGHHPDLTAEQVRSIFETYFGDRYEIIPTPRQRLCDFVVKKNAWIGVAVRLKQQANKTKLVFYGFAPSYRARVVLVLTAFLVIGPLILYLVVWKRLTDEVRAFIEAAEEFR